MSGWLEAAWIFGAIFVLRIVFPVFLLAAAAYTYRKWEEKKWADAVTRQDAESAGEPGAEAKVPRALQQPCYEEKGCNESAYRKCPAYRNLKVPCWAMRQMAEGYIQPACYQCDRFTHTPELRNAA